MVTTGRRAPRPVTVISQARGLSDDMWNLIERCWATDPGARPTAAEILDMLPQIVDTRPLYTSDTFDVNLPSRLSHEQSNHPFSLLARYAESTGENEDEVGEDSWNFTNSGF